MKFSLFAMGLSGVIGSYRGEQKRPLLLMYAFCILLTWYCHGVSKSQNLRCISLEFDFFGVNVFSESKSKSESR